MNNLSTLNHQRDVLNTKLNKIMKFINEYVFKHINDTKKYQLCFHQFWKIQTSLCDLIRAYITVLGKEDENNSVEITGEFEDKLVKKAGKKNDEFQNCKTQFILIIDNNKNLNPSK